MGTDWFQRVGSSIPRGFSRYFILDLLTTKPHTGKEIIDVATEQREGKWKPSPGLIYPLLGRLLDEGMVEETKDGKYQITKKGKATSDDLQTVNKIIKNQLDVLLRIGNIGRFAAMDILERMSVMGDSLSSNVIKMTKEETRRYRKFLEEELKKMDERNTQSKEIKID